LNNPNCEHCWVVKAQLRLKTRERAVAPLETVGNGKR